MTRDLRREREIAKAAGPLRVWRSEPDRRTKRVSARQARDWLRDQERETREREAAAEREGAVIDINQEFDTKV